MGYHGAGKGGMLGPVETRGQIGPGVGYPEIFRGGPAQ